MSFSPKMRNVYTRNTLVGSLKKGDPRQVPRSPPLKRTTGYSDVVRICNVYFSVLKSKTKSRNEYFNKPVTMKRKSKNC